MQELGHPVAGDKKYGAITNPLRRLALHARVLAFHHPVDGRLHRYETPVPPAFAAMFSSKNSAQF
jgi:23S rRNA pseudouridine1911/1915/1917 synthase